MRRAIIAQAALGAGLLCGTARGDDRTAVERALAETLFQEGKRLLSAGDVAGACDKLGKSHKLDPQVGTLLNLAVCHERQGKTATAWVEFREAKAQAARSGQTERLALAQEHIAELEPRLSRIVVRVRSPARAQVVALEGKPLAAELWGEAIPVDPGALRVEASAPGRVAWSRVVEIPGDAATATVEIAMLADASGGEGRVVPRARPASDTASTRRMFGWAAGGVGGAMLVVGGYFGVQALATKSEGEAHCVGARCDAVGLDRMSTGRGQADVSTVFIGAGAALVAAGAVLVWTAPAPAQRVGVALGSGGARLVVVP